MFSMQCVVMDSSSEETFTERPVIAPSPYGAFRIADKICLLLLRALRQDYNLGLLKENYRGLITMENTVGRAISLIHINAQRCIMRGDHSVTTKGVGVGVVAVV